MPYKAAACRAAVPERKDAMGEVTSSDIYLLLFICIYVIPGIIASHQGKRNAGGIWVLTLLLGWTLIGWAIALVWSLTPDHKSQEQHSNAG
ncbi:MAG: superinfection immunity protein [Acidobacteriota bacterium]